MLLTRAVDSCKAYHQPMQNNKNYTDTGEKSKAVLFSCAGSWRKRQGYEKLVQACLEEQEHRGGETIETPTALSIGCCFLPCGESCDEFPCGGVAEKSECREWCRLEAIHSSWS